MKINFQFKIQKSNGKSILIGFDKEKHDVKAGSAVLFDGRMLHRACAHPSTHPRQMIYLVFHR